MVIPRSASRGNDRVGPGARLFGSLVVSVGLTFLLAPSVSAQAPVDPSDTCVEYTPSDVTVSDASVDPGQSITVSGIAGIDDPVTISIVSRNGGEPTVLANVTSDSTGRFSATVVIPASFPPGTYSILVTSGACPELASLDINVGSVTEEKPPPSTGSTGSTGGGPLPNTGSPARLFVRIGLAAVGLGTIMVLKSRQRRRSIFAH